MTYNAHPDLAKVYPYDDIHKSLEEYASNGSPMYAPLTVQFSQSSTQTSYTATRKTMYEVLQQFGSYLSFCNFLAILFLATFQKHSLDKSFIKKLYSANPESVEDDTDASAKHYNADKDMRLKKAITDRTVFSYPFWRSYCYQKFGSRWCCCCRVKPRRDDWLQSDAKEKLN